MLWFWISLAAFFCLALAAVIDKFLLSKTPLKPLSFAFLISFGGAVFSLVFLFSFSGFNGLLDYWWQFLAGGAGLFFGLYLMFLAVNQGEVSKINPLIVSLTPIAAFVFSWLEGLQLLSILKVVGAVLIIVSGYFLSIVSKKNSRLNGKVWWLMIFSALLFGLANVFSKIVYDVLPFAEAFIGLRWISFLSGVVFILIFRKGREIVEIFVKKDNVADKRKLALIFLLIGQTAGALGVILQQYAIKFGNVILVTAMNGVQFFFVLILVFGFSRFFPKVLQEDISRKSILKKFFWSAILFLGIALIYV